MKHLSRAPLLTCAISLCSAPLLAADPGITLIGIGVVPGNAFDESGLQGQAICRIDDETTCTDQATLGGFGSALSYTGHDNVFIATNDRGTFDGRNDVPYLDRFHFFHITLDPGAPFPNIETVLLDTLLLRNRRGQPFIGDASAFDLARPARSSRLDPEGIRVSRDGTLLIQDHGLNTDTPPGRVGVNNRVLTIDVRSGATREFDAAAAGVRYQPQRLPEPLFPRRQLRRALRQR